VGVGVGQAGAGVASGRMSRYLVELKPGREVLYQTPAALRVAIESGEITGQSRIFHRATATWISIHLHPEYRRFQTERHPPSWMTPTNTPPAELAADPAPRRRRGLRVLKRIADIYHRASSHPAAPTQPGRDPDQPGATPTRARWTFYP
jgi:hypothetical protein